METDSAGGNRAPESGPDGGRTASSCRPCPMIVNGERCGEVPSLTLDQVEKLNEQFEAQLQIVQDTHLDERYKVTIYADWVNHLRMLVSELVQSLHEMQDVCIQRLQLLKANFAKDAARFGADRLQRLKSDDRALMELIKRDHRDGDWTGDSVKFHDVTVAQPLDDHERDVVPGPSPVQADGNGAEMVSLKLEVTSNFPLEPVAGRRMEAEPEKDALICKLQHEVKSMRQEIAVLKGKLRTAVLAKDQQQEQSCQEIKQLQHKVETLGGQLVQQQKPKSHTATDNESLISEITDLHDTNKQLKRKLHDAADKQEDANKRIQYNDKVIQELREEIKRLNQKLKPADSVASVTTPQPTAVAAASPTGSFCASSTIADDSFEVANRSAVLAEIDRVNADSNVETDHVNTLKLELSSMTEELHKHSEDKLAQHAIIAEQQAKLEAQDNKLRQLGHELESCQRKLYIMRSECIKLSEAIRKRLQLDTSYPVLEDLSLPVDFLQTEPHWNLDGKDLEKDRELATFVQRLVEALVQKQQQPVTPTHCEPTDTITTNLINQQKRIGHVVEEITEELSNLVGTNVSSDSLSSLPEQYQPPLNSLIGNLQKELDTKSLVLRDRNEELEQTRRQLGEAEKEVLRYKLHEESAEAEKARYERVINTFEQTVRDREHTVDLLKQEKQNLEQQLHDAREMLQTCREDQQESDKKRASIEDECKNQLVTISNLRVALEEIKRSGNSSVNVLHEVVEDLQMEVVVLSEQLNDAYRENLAKEQEIDQYRDSNLELRSQLADINHELSVWQDIVGVVESRRQIDDQRQHYFDLIKNDQKSLIHQMTLLRKEIECGQQDSLNLAVCRQRCIEMEQQHDREMSQQRTKHSSELMCLRGEIELMTKQLADSQELNKQHEQLEQQSKTFQEVIKELRNHNDLIQRNIVSYQSNVEQLQQNLAAVNHQLSVARDETEELRSRQQQYEELINTMGAQRDKLLAELGMQKKLCKCGANGSASKERIKVPLSHTLQKQLIEKSLELTKCSEELRQAKEQWKRQQSEYVEQRVRLNDKAAELHNQLGVLNGKISNLEHSIITKDEQIERLQRKLQDTNGQLVEERELLHQTEAKTVTLTQALEQRVKELSGMQMNSTDQRKQLQQCEAHVVRYKQQMRSMAEKSEELAKERDMMCTETRELREKLATQEGKESALCELLKASQKKVFADAARIAEVEENNRALNERNQYLENINEDLSKRSKTVDAQLEQITVNNRNLLEYKQQTECTIDLARKCEAEAKERKIRYEREIERLNKGVKSHKLECMMLFQKLQSYHTDNTILNQKLQAYQERDEDSRRNHTTPLHKTYYPPEVKKLVRSSSDPNCNEPDELLQRVQNASNQIHLIRKYWYRGIKEVFPSMP